MKTSTGKLQDQIWDNYTDITNLQSQITSNDAELDVLRTSTGYLQDQINVIDGDCSTRLDALETTQTLIQTSTGQLQEQLTVCCDESDSRLDYLESCCDQLSTSSGELQSQITGNDADITNLQSQITTNDNDIGDLQADVTNLQSQIASNDADIASVQNTLALIQTSTGQLQAQLITCCDEHSSRLEFLENLDRDYDSGLDLLKTCCDNSNSRLDTLENVDMDYDSRLDSLEQIDRDYDSRLDHLESWSDQLSTSSGELQSQIDRINTIEGYGSTIEVSGEVYFDYSMLPAQGEAIKLQLLSSCGQQSKLIFDPAVYDPEGTNNGVIALPPSSCLTLCGEGDVLLKDGVHFLMQGDLFDAEQTDWPSLVIDEHAFVRLDDNATVKIAGEGINTCAGRFVIKSSGCLILDKNCQFIVGETGLEAVEVRVEFLGAIIVDHPDAYLTFQMGQVDLIVTFEGLLCVHDGIIEFNTNRGDPAAGFVRTFYITEDGSLQINKKDFKLGLMCFAPNIGDLDTDFNSLGGDVGGEGHIQFIDTENNIDSRIKIQPNTFAMVDDIVDIFMLLGCFYDTVLSHSPTAHILVKLGSTDPNQDGRLAVLHPYRDGSIVLMEKGDYNIAYAGDKIIGYGVGGPFVIDANGVRRVIS